MGTFRNQIGALKEILKSGEYCANVAVLPATAIDSSGKPSSPTSTPHLDALGPLDTFPALTAAQLPEVCYPKYPSYFSCETSHVIHLIRQNSDRWRLMVVVESVPENGVFCRLLCYWYNAVSAFFKCERRD